MRVTGGKLAGRSLKAPASSATRPVTDKVRAAIFSSLGERTQGARALDLYAGSGALGIEALSRGARNVDFVDRSKAALTSIKQNLQSLDLAGNSRVHGGLVESFIGKQLEAYDLIFFDPPYADFDTKVVTSLDNLLQYSGLLIISCSSKTDLPDKIGGFEVVSRKIYGDTQIGYFEKEPKSVTLNH